MKRALFVCLVAFSGWAHTPAVAKQAPVPELELTDDESVAGEFLGRKLHFVLDTGTTRSFVDVKVAKAAGSVLRQTYSLSGFGPKYQQAGLLSKSIKVQFPFAGGTVDHEFLNVADYRRLSALRGRELDGILGADFIERFVVEIDYQAQRVRLHPRSFKLPKEAVTLPMTLSYSRTPLVDIRIQLTPESKAIKAKAMFDTGAGGYLIAEDSFTKKHRMREQLGGIDIPLGEGVGGQIAGRLTRLPILELATFRLSQSVVGLMAGPSGPSNRREVYDINVGVAVLKRFSVFFDYGRHKVGLIPNDRLHSEFEGMMTGLKLATLGWPHDRVVVDAVIPNSPAAEAGFEPGDEIVEVDDERLGPLALIDLQNRLSKAEGTLVKIRAQRKSMRGLFTLVLRRMVEP